MKSSFVVTGGSSGIGAAVIREIEARYAPSTRMITNLDVRTNPSVDVRNYDQVLQAMQNAVVPGGKHFFVGSAGVLFLAGEEGGPVDFASADIDRLHMMIDVNLNGMVNAVHAFLKVVFAAEGTANIVLISSISAVHSGGPNMAVYDATKAAVTAFAQRLVPYRSRGVRVNVIQPGSVRTNIGSWNPDYSVSRMGRGLVASGQDADARRLGTEVTVEQVAYLTMLLLNDKFGLNGAVLTVDEGLTLLGREGYE